MTKSGIALKPECPKSFKTINPTLSPFSSYFCKRLIGDSLEEAKKRLRSGFLSFYNSLCGEI
jgi:hypothetical protein